MSAATGDPSRATGPGRPDEQDEPDDGDEQNGPDETTVLGFDGMHDRVPRPGPRRPWTDGGSRSDGRAGAGAGQVSGPGRGSEPDWVDAADADGWAAEDAELSQLVRPYTLTRGRTRHAEGASFDVIAQIIAVDRSGLPDSDAQDGAEGPEHQAILDLVLQRPLSVAEVAAGTDLPLGVARILLGDLLDADLIRVSRPATALLPDTTVLRDVIRGLRAL